MYPGVTFSYTGAEPVAKGLTKLGLLKLREVEQFMQYQNLQQHKRVFDIAQGVTITAQKVFGISKVFIHVDPRGGGEEEKDYICLCNCNFAFGIILEEQETLLDDLYPLYTALVCRQKKAYAIERDLLPSDWSKYIPGQKVVLIPYYLMEYTCCTEMPVASGCAPVRSEEEQSSDLWRTTMRIIPWRAFTLKKRLVVRG